LVPRSRTLHGWKYLAMLTFTLAKVDLTSLVIGNLSDVHTAKTVTFQEPSHLAAFGMIARTANGVFRRDWVGSAMVKCKATRLGSAWSDIPTDSGWRSNKVGF
jgi:hypothetical protein